ncbi:MAG: alpha/beta hydrolase [Paracoccaceae bacterium]
MNHGFANSRRITINGARLAYVEQGSGDPVVLVHGGVSDLRTWDSQGSALGQHFRVVAYSRRYARPNAEIPEGAADPMQAHVDDLVALIEARKFGPAHLVGHSLGGFIALLVAIQRPDLVRSLVLIEPPVLTLFADVPLKPWQVLRLLLSRPRTAVALLRFGAGVMRPAQKAFRQDDEKAAIEAFGKGVLGKTYFQTLSAARYQQVWENRKADRAQILGQSFAPLKPAEVAAVEIPVLLLCGSDSPKLFHRLTLRLAELLPKARISRIENASHILHEDKPSSVNAEIVKFLQGRGR